MGNLLGLTATIFAASVFTTSAASASADNAIFVLKLSGDRGWSVECEIERHEDDPLTIRKKGRGDIETISTRGVSGGSCSYAAPGNGELKIIFSNDGQPDQCPFEVEYDQCVGRFSNGSKGSFDF
ncbi:hypothetical protein [Parvularcula marina]|uniref:Uncharacterized protein n=1 Tax=Parvularcula marina TaxID=2292771 RepID=A0A371RF91_9PROT|nr:hypothetical protein [Parvularcula marina]RFB04095.1 hypothetical protein DX908_01645 [Parvularcula marina]